MERKQGNFVHARANRERGVKREWRFVPDGVGVSPRAARRGRGEPVRGPRPPKQAIDVSSGQIPDDWFRYSEMAHFDALIWPTNDGLNWPTPVSGVPALLSLFSIEVRSAALHDCASRPAPARCLRAASAR